jgi:hypothetical protein
MRFGTWNVRSLYRASLPRIVAEEISKYNLGLVGVQGGAEVALSQQANKHFSVVRGMRTMN